MQIRNAMMTRAKNIPGRAARTKPSEGDSSGLRLRCRGSVPAIGHELVEFSLVLGHAQPLEKLSEFTLFFLEAPQRLAAIFVKGAIAAGPLRAPPIATAAHLTLPSGHAVMIPATHSSAP